MTDSQQRVAILWAAAGWVPEHAWGGIEVVINGRTVVRRAMIEKGDRMGDHCRT